MQDERLKVKGNPIKNTAQNIYYFAYLHKKLVVFTALFLCFAILLTVSAGLVFSLYSRKGSSKFYEFAYGESRAQSIETAESADGILKTRGERIEIESPKGEYSAVFAENINKSNSYAVIAHGYCQSPYLTEKYARIFYDLGFNVLVPYLSGSEKGAPNPVLMGESDGEIISAFVDWITDNGESSRIILFGVSTGSYAALQAASNRENANLKGVIADSCYSDLWDLSGDYLENSLGISAFPVRNIASLISDLVCGKGFKETGPEALAEKIEIPVLFIHGENDSTVTVLHNNHLFESFKSEEKKQVIINGARHGDLLETDPEKYNSVIENFILTNLGK